MNRGVLDPAEPGPSNGIEWLCPEQKLLSLVVASRPPIFVFIVCVLAATVSPAAAQTPSDVESLRKQLDVLRQEKTALERELSQCRAIVEGFRTSPPVAASDDVAVRISLEGRPTRGQDASPVSIIEFCDYQSPHCARFFKETYPEIERDFVLPGTVRYVFKDFPSQTVHPQAFKAHEAALCAGDQGKYWEMHDLLLTRQDALAPERLVEHAQDLGLNTDTFRFCLTSGGYAEAIHRDVAEAASGGVHETPVFAIGLTEPGMSSVRVMRVVVGLQPFEVFKEVIEAVLETAQDGG